MPKYKLIYFNARGRAEISRLIFAAVGQEYEDVRIEGKEWPGMKSKTPQGQLPILEIEDSDGKKMVIPQGMAICRHLARTFGLYGKTKKEMIEVDVVLETVNDMKTELFNIQRELQKDESKKNEFDRKMRTEIIPKYLSIFDGIAKNNANTCRNSYMVGGSCTVADLAVFEVFETLQQKYNNVLDLARYMKANFKKVSENRRIKDWIEKRTKTTF